MVWQCKCIWIHSQHLRQEWMQSGYQYSEQKASHSPIDHEFWGKKITSIWIEHTLQKKLFIHNHDSILIQYELVITNFRYIQSDATLHTSTGASSDKSETETILEISCESRIFAATLPSNENVNVSISKINKQPK